MHARGVNSVKDQESILSSLVVACRARGTYSDLATDSNRGGLRMLASLGVFLALFFFCAHFRVFCNFLHTAHKKNESTQ